VRDQGIAAHLAKEMGMTTEKNRLVMQRFTAFINTASKQLAAELIAPNAVFHAPGQREPMRGPDGYLTIIGMMRGGFPDIMRGTHQGVFFGVPPTGKSIEVQAMNFYRFSAGQIVEERGQPDLLGLMQQIGAIPM
jgi:predicted ester cyclase